MSVIATLLTRTLQNPRPILGVGRNSHVLNVLAFTFDPRVSSLDSEEDIDCRRHHDCHWSNTAHHWVPSWDHILVVARLHRAGRRPGPLVARRYGPRGRRSTPLLLIGPDNIVRKGDAVRLAHQEVNPSSELSKIRSSTANGHVSSDWRHRRAGQRNVSF